ncbi:MAG TPA: hypothetical protein VKT81_25675, partial [Bryobacteraceae bacterium]|nr:hypothetical protein [Bryobacteraceae bacterium]
MIIASSTNQFVHSFFDDTFAGVHHLEWFDLALLVPYFLLLLILSVYGCHRYEMIRRYMKHKKDILSAPPILFENLPRVTVQLPIYNERYVVERLLEEVSKMEYPRHLLQIQVLDDSTDDTHPFTERLVAEYRNAGLPIEYIHRA